MMSEMKEDVRVMVVREGSSVALGDKLHQPHVACLTFGTISNDHGVLWLSMRSSFSFWF